MNIVIVEDVVDLREEMADFFRSSGHGVQCAGNSFELNQLLARAKPHLVFLDIGLPGEDGISICERLQEQPDLHIAMLTARGGIQDRRSGLLAGADSYLVKPVDYDELQAVIRRVERRRKVSLEDLHAWSLAVTRQCLKTPDGQEIPLSLRETRLIQTLVERVEHQATREELMEALGLSTALDDRRIEVILSRLRAKIRQHADFDLPVKANRSVGYSFAEHCRISD